MSLPRIFLALTLFVFGGIAVAALMKRDGGKPEAVVQNTAPLELVVEEQDPVVYAADDEEEEEEEEVEVAFYSPQGVTKRRQEEISLVNRIDEFFSTGKRKFDIVETIKYKSRVPWLKGRSAWLSDYAGHFGTSRHFIARSLNRKPDYDTQNVSEGDRFNVLRTDKNVQFHLLLDTILCKMWFYYIDLDTNERVLVKTYDVGIGRPDESKESGLSTPLGKYSLGSKIAIYRPGTEAFYNGEKTEMVRVFGTRWIPFGEEIGEATEPARGLGIHGLPLVQNDEGKWAEDVSTIGDYASDGCIRLKTEDMEELFSVIITKPTVIELVTDYREAKLPGNEQS